MTAKAHKRPVGRPSDYSAKVAEEICERIATTPRGLDYICAQDETLPHPSTVYRWQDEHPEFRESFARAKERQADLIFGEALEIADTPVTGIERTTKADGSVETREGDMLGHRRLQVETRLKMAGKLAPKKYGDRLTTELTGKDGGPVETVTRIERVIVGAPNSDPIGEP